MLLPIGTNIRPRRTPYANYAIIALNVAMFLLTYDKYNEFIGDGWVERVIRPWADQLKLYPNSPFIWQYVTYAFLHAGWMHIIGNMYFLYLFGKNVNDKMGNIGYICFYLAGGVFSGIGHVIWAQSPVLGASGAVAAVTGAYLVLFPRSIVTVAYWLFFIGTFEVQASLFIAIKMIVIDNLLYATSAGVAYDAHLSGYAYGILVTMLLLSTKLIRTEQATLWMIVKQWNRRRQFRHQAPGQYPHNEKKWVKATETKKSPQQIEKERKIAEIRSGITDSMSSHDLPNAVREYLELIAIDDEQVMPRQQQLDIANQMMAEGKWAFSANAYEKFLKHYGNTQHNEQVELMLGILYARYLNKSDKAIKYLDRARKKIADPGQIKMCEEELKKLGPDIQ
ncbi:MAG: rhomboid family intramembrane serine protease [Planctomycetes bacterium]|nr:rhomboid family intramembrane serine protease [Planctomycetota bacterium]